MKNCSKCNIQKPLSEFYKNVNRKDGHNAYCKKCHKEYTTVRYENNKKVVKARADKWYKENPERKKEIARKYARNNKQKQRNIALKRCYGITLDEFNDLVEQQDHKCDICKTVFAGTRDTHMDHCHQTGKIRGVLCSKCNKGLGQFKDSVSYLQKAIEYLEKYDAEDLL